MRVARVLEHKGPGRGQERLRLGASQGESPVGAHHPPERQPEDGGFANAASPYTAPEMTSGPVTDLVLASAGPPASTSRAIRPATASAPSFTLSLPACSPHLNDW